MGTFANTWYGMYELGTGTWKSDSGDTVWMYGGMGSGESMSRSGEGVVDCDGFDTIAHEQHYVVHLMCCTVLCITVVL